MSKVQSKNIIDYTTYIISVKQMPFYKINTEIYNLDDKVRQAMTYTLITGSD
jgi:hypothetical protein